MCMRRTSAARQFNAPCPSITDRYDLTDLILNLRQRGFIGNDRTA